MYRRLFGILALLSLAAFVGGCLYDSPLSEPSTNIDTRLLGVFEFRQEIKEKGKRPQVRIHRVAVLPRDVDHYRIYYRDYGRKPVRTLQFTGWISRVGAKYYLSVRDDNESSSGYGKYAFMRFEWRWPGDIRVSAPEMAGYEQASSFKLRKAVRQKLRDDTLFPFEATLWKKLARIHSRGPGKQSLPSEIPPSFDTGEDVFSAVLPRKAEKAKKAKPD